MSGIIVTDATFKSEVIESSLPVLVDFWAPWCGPCKMVAPIIEELAKTFEGKLIVRKLNVDENPQSAGVYGITAIPTLVIFKNGKVIEKIVGLKNKQEIESKLNTLT